ncbi:MAG: pilus assembly protein PilP [Chromatiaceae bacterium]|nr:MAG: pilus assembly protein PilP [Chromatiaceae bacterium]
MRSARISITALALILGLAGCGAGGMDDLVVFTEEVKARPAQPLEPLPEIPTVETFVFDPGGRRDPFMMDDQSLQAATPQTAGDIAPDPLRSKEELEQYALDSLRMVGTLEQDDTRWALITTPDGILHRVLIGNYLGQNNGQIIRIDAAQIELIEIVSDGTGQWQKRQTSIALRQ